MEEQEDAYLLKIVEGYCNPQPQCISKQNSRMNISSTTLPKLSTSYERPQVIVAGDEKILIEEQDGDAVVFKEKTLVDTVYDLSGDVNSLRKVSLF